MTIHLVNPNYNMILNANTAENTSNRNTTASTGNSSGGNQSFSEVLNGVISNMQPQASAAGVATPEASGNVKSENDGPTSPQSAESAVTTKNTVAPEGTAAAPAPVSQGTINLDEIFQKAADTYQIPVQLLKAVARAESNFNPLSQSGAGAQGIMQLMPGTARSLGVTNAFDPEQNIMGGAKYLSQQLARYDGNAVLALAAYNAGPGNVKKYNGVPPFKETQNYIAKVMAYAGEPISAGEIRLVNRQPITAAASGTIRQSVAAGTNSMTQPVTNNTNSIIQDLEQKVLGKDPQDVDKKDAELLLNLYRYQMQLNVLEGFDSDSDSDRHDLFDNFKGLV